MKRLLPLLLLLPLVATGPAHAQADPSSRSSNQPVAPYRIAGNLYYVGASDVTSFLIATPDGLILIDGGFAETVPIIRESVKKLGFKIEDVKVLLNSHAHFDHAGGLAELKKITGAKLAASAADAALLARGGRGDHLFGDQYPYEPVTADRILSDGDQVALGGTTLTAHLTAGHTKGCTTWTMKAAEGGKSYDVVFVCSTTVLPGVSLTNNPKYPHVAADFENTFRTLRSLPCDVFLASHASFYDGLKKAERLRKSTEKNPFIDPAGYKAYLDRSEKAFRERLAAERKPKQVQPSGG
ncbi:MAG TPA: subclass B3 metallo-beta-lactamase [Thermoanaerobaculia bacterium]|jgi:metallo-beta-lactamase class B|nr:subclass B3 metallo-beta-lactamase [Thermoanaerobaculia bacterium]